MTKQILIVTASKDTAEVVQSRLDKVGEERAIDLYHDWARHAKEAELRLERSAYDLVISDVDIPGDGNSVLREGERLGLKLLQRDRDGNRAVPCILLDALYNREVSRQASGKLSIDYVTREELDWDDWLAELCKKDLFAETAKSKPLHLDLDIILPDNHYILEIVGMPGSRVDGGLTLNDAALKKLVRASRGIQVDGNDWEEDLRSIGDELGTQIFESNFAFASKFFEYLGRVKDRENVTIRFVVRRDIHPIALEAIKDKAAEHFWMLSAPVYRRLQEFTDRYALYQDEETKTGPINCLIIQADVECKVKIPEFGIDLSRLENVRSEARWLRFYLNALKREKPNHIGEIAIMSGPAAAVHEALKSGKWHIVHYAGHSFFNASTNVGYLFFPSGKGGRVERITAEEFASWLHASEVRFVYLSSCHSSEDDFVFELANGHVPAIVGFRWDIPDKHAKQYTRCFYQNLLERRSLEYAFFEARKQMHAKYRTEPIWASPMLVIQTKAQ